MKKFNRKNLRFFFGHFAGLDIIFPPVEYYLIEKCCEWHSFAISDLQTRKFKNNCWFWPTCKFLCSYCLFSFYAHIFKLKFCLFLKYSNKLLEGVQPNLLGCHRHWPPAEHLIVLVVGQLSQKGLTPNLQKIPFCPFWHWFLKIEKLPINLLVRKNWANIGF